MKKVVYTFLALIVVSSISFAQMKLQLPIEITGESSQRVRVFYWKITGTALGTNSILVENKPFFELLNNTVLGIDGNLISVYNVLGQKIKKANSITLTKGVYIVQSHLGETQRVFMK